MFRLLALPLLLSFRLLAQSPTSEQLAGVFGEYGHTDRPGCAAGVEGSAGKSWIGAYGMADMEHAVANTLATVFEAGSVSK